ncbi:MAG: hypothetical protein ABIR91_05085 [Candidatus Saccharimonadales bacterium]
MLPKVISISVGVAIVLLAVVLQTTTPTTIGPLGILFVFILIYIVALGMLTFLLRVASRILAKVSRSLTVRRPMQELTVGRSYYFSSILALGPVMLVGMQSVGEVGIYDMLLLVVFITISCIYIAKRSR